MATSSKDRRHQKNYRYRNSGSNYIKINKCIQVACWSLGRRKQGIHLRCWPCWHSHLFSSVFPEPPTQDQNYSMIYYIIYMLGALLNDIKPNSRTSKLWMDSIWSEYWQDHWEKIKQRIWVYTGTETQITTSYVHVHIDRIWTNMPTLAPGDT